MKRLYFFLILIVITENVFAQQEPVYSQYMFNGLAINPAYAGSHDVNSVTALGRWQWTGLEGAPKTWTFSFHAPIQKVFSTEKSRMAAGFNLVHDEIGTAKRTFANAAFAYIIPIDKGSLSFGLKAGLVRAKFDQSGIVGVDPNDPVLRNNFDPTTKPDLGFGVYYYSDRLFLGASIPSGLQEMLVEEDEPTTADIRQHYFLYAGYIIKLSEIFDLKPNVLAKGVKGAPLQFDINANVYWKERIGLGLSYRQFDTMTILSQFFLNQNFMFGYAFEFANFSSLNEVQSGTHEIVLNYRFSFQKKIILTPRLF
ncbi:MAG: type IX secretion system membrane protein PorP/SprF [Flammeovirgaceae bacterium]|nr:type IX secretion system membrane protein PorP/SprF [Flammeovirgaceae bacterium]